MLSFIFAIIFIILFIGLIIFGGNFVLRGMLEKMVGSKNEHFENNDINNISKMDDCKKIDVENENHLNFQTATNIPLSPFKYNNYIGKVYMNKDANIDANFFSNNDLDKGKYSLNKPRLLYDGIWNQQINIDKSYQDETWKLTNGNLSGGYYSTNKFIETNKQVPKDYIDHSATSVNNDINSYYYTYFNDTENDIYDTQITCFPSVFTAGITEDLKKII